MRTRFPGFSLIFAAVRWTTTSIGRHFLPLSLPRHLREKGKGESSLASPVHSEGNGVGDYGAESILEVRRRYAKGVE